MRLYNNYPIPSDRMGALYALGGIEDAYIIEFGPAGTTHFAIEGFMQIDAPMHNNTYTTHIDETDITFGDESRLVNAIKEIDKNKSPKYIFILGSTITSIIGIDLLSITSLIQSEINAILIPVPNCDFESNYLKGYKDILSIISKKIVKPNLYKTNSFNILGLFINDYNYKSEIEEIKRLMKTYFNFELNSVFLADSDISSLENSGCASINIVLKSEALEAAKYLDLNNNQPFTSVYPFGINKTELFLNSISKLINKEYDKDLFNKEKKAFIDASTDFKNLIKNKSNNVQLNLSNPEIKNHYKDFLSELGLKIDNSANSILHLGNDFSNKDNLPYFQISHPSYKKINRYPFTPYLGTRGALYLTQQLYNLI